MAPIEKDLIKKKMLNKKEIGWLNKYHTKVKKNLFKLYKKNFFLVVLNIKYFS